MLRNQNQVLIVDDDNRLHYRTIEVMRFDNDDVIVQAGLQTGETVNVSPIQTVIEGMRVNPVRDVSTLNYSVRDAGNEG